MKKIKSTVKYHVPNWNFCNSDNLLPGGYMNKDTCRFCVKTKIGYHCMLYDEPLSSKAEFISKLRECCKATAGYESVIDEPPAPPAISPKDLMKQSIDLYNKTLNELLAQGYPRQMAEVAAKQIILGD